MDLSILNDKQREAVETTEGPLLLLAGAGSGKTRVLTHRIAYLIEMGLSPLNILAITFTNKAAKEMKERVMNLIPEGKYVWISTFHSTCVRILRREITKLGYASSFTIFDTDDSERLMKSIIKQLNINDKQFPARSILHEIGRQKDELISPTQYDDIYHGDFRKAVIGKAYHMYQKKLFESNALDFDDIIFKTVQLFLQHPDVLEKYQEKFLYILVDEYQDTNTSQYQLIRLLSAKNKNLCVVGDDDQSIYSFRGANIRNILDFEKDFKNVKTIKLEQNYRSTANILNAANAVIKNNSGRKVKKLWTDKGDGFKIKFLKAPSDMDEAAFIAKTIKKEAADESYSNFAVLYRTNAQSRSLEEALNRLSLPYRIIGGIKYYDRREVKDIVAYLRCVANPSDGISMNRIINVPKRGIGSATVDKVTEFANDNDMSFFSALKRIDEIIPTKTKIKSVQAFTELIEELETLAKELPISQFIEVLLEKTGYIDNLIIENPEDGNERADNVRELISKAVQFEKNEDLSPEDKLLDNFLHDSSLSSDIDNYEENAPTVTLMTIHSAKGLEFPTVFLTGMEEGVFPSYRSSLTGSEEDLEEERRLCYVAITRAKEQLYVTCAGERLQFGKTVYNSPSRFLKEIPSEYIEGAIKKPPLPDKPGRNIANSILHESVKNKNLRNEAKNYLSQSSAQIPAPKNIVLDFKEGDIVSQPLYGKGEVIAIKNAGADYEVTVSFARAGTKKFMAHLSKLKKVEQEVSNE